jgi:hypothetical protein
MDDKGLVKKDRSALKALGWFAVIILVVFGVPMNIGGSGAGNGALLIAFILGVVLVAGGRFSLLEYTGRRELSPLPQSGGMIQQQKNRQEENAIDYLSATVLGNTAKGRTIAVDDVQRQSGCYVLGVQGVGKSSLLEGMIYQDICKGYSVIVLDPHGDLIDHALAQLPDNRLKDVSLLSLEDTAFPFGLNLFSSRQGASDIEQSQALDRILHVFEKCFPDTSRMLLEKYLGNIAPVFFANAGAGYGMTDIPNFLMNEDFREQLVGRARLFIKQFWLQDYAAMSPSVRRSETGSLATRLNRFMRSPIVGNIIGQATTTIDFRRAIENKEIIFVKLPVKTLKDDATLIGTMLVAQIHAAIFSFADMKLEDRPGFSLYVDEHQHFCSSDFAEMFTEGRKYGARVVTAHQFRSQLPDYLASASMTARTKITFQTTQEDAPKLAPLYIAQDRAGEIVIDPDPVRELEQYASKHPQYREVGMFVDVHLRPMQTVRRGKRVETEPDGYKFNRWVEDPEPYLNDLLYRVQMQKNYTLPIPYEVAQGFAARRFWKAWKRQRHDAGYLLSGDMQFPLDVMARPPRTEQGLLYHFLYTLRRVMVYLVQDPIGEKQGLSNSQVAQEIMNLPRRHALVKIGNDVSEVMTFDTPSAVAPAIFDRRRYMVVGQTRQKYCRPAAEVEREIERRLGIAPAAGQQNTQGQNVQPGAAVPDNVAAPQEKDRFIDIDGN